MEKKFVLEKPTDVDDELPKEKHIFIDRVLKLAHEDKKFSVSDVRDETNTVLLAVSKIVS